MFHRYTQYREMKMQWDSMCWKILSEKKPPFLPETVENIRLQVRLIWFREEPGYFCLIRFIRRMHRETRSSGDFLFLLWTGKSSSTRWNWINLKKPDIIIKSGKEAIRMTSRLLLHSAQILKRMIHWKLPVKFRMIHGILKSFRETDGLLQCRSYGDC